MNNLQLLNIISWHDGEPNNSGGTNLYINEDRGQIILWSNVGLNDLTGYAKCYYICELNMCSQNEYYDTSGTPSHCSNFLLNFRHASLE